MRLVRKGAAVRSARHRVRRAGRGGARPLRLHLRPRLGSDRRPAQGLEPHERAVGPAGRPTQDEHPCPRRAGDGRRCHRRVLRRVRGEPMGRGLAGVRRPRRAARRRRVRRRCCAAGSSACGPRTGPACGCASSRSAGSSTSRRRSTPRRRPSGACCGSTPRGRSPSTRSTGGSAPSPCPPRSRRTPACATSTWPRSSPVHRVGVHRARPRAGAAAGGGGSVGGGGGGGGGGSW